MLENSPKICEIGVCGEKITTAITGVEVEKRSKDVNVKDHDYQPKYDFVFMCEPFVITITQVSYKRKEGANNMSLI